MKKRRPLLRFSKWFALSMFITTIGACAASTETAYILDGPFGQFRLIYSALEVSNEGSEHFDWSTMDRLSSKANGLMYWDLRMTPRGVIVPLYYPGIILFILTPLLWWLDRNRKHPAGYCETCGYDISGQIEARCPECGNSFDPKLIKAVD